MKRDVAVMLRVTSAERKKFERRAKRVGLSLSAWMRMSLLVALRESDHVRAGKHDVQTK
jgi:hypothetical protein